MAKTKAELVKELEEKGIQADPAKHSVKELEDMLNQAPDETSGKPDAVAKLREPGGVTRRKVNRGSTRRLVRALENFDKAIDVFITEVDIQAFVTDEKGERIDELEMVKGLRSLKQEVANGIAEITAPPAAD